MFTVILHLVFKRKEKDDKFWNYKSCFIGNLIVFCVKKIVEIQNLYCCSWLCLKDITKRKLLDLHFFEKYKFLQRHPVNWGKKRASKIRESYMYLKHRLFKIEFFEYNYSRKNMLNSSIKFVACMQLNIESIRTEKGIYFTRSDACSFIKI